MPIASHMPCASGASAVGNMRSAIASIAVLRARFTDHPRAINQLESQPPPMEPRSAVRYTAMSGSVRPDSLTLYLASRNLGSQYR